MRRIDLARLAALDDRLAGLTSSDRDVDYEIEEILGEELFARYGYRRQPGDTGWRTHDTDAIVDHVGPAMDYTGSLDAALHALDEIAGPRRRVVTEAEKDQTVVSIQGEGDAFFRRRIPAGGSTGRILATLRAAIGFRLAMENEVVDA